MKILGTKMKMTQIYVNDAIVPVTQVSVAPDADMAWLTEGMRVKVSGTSKSKGFQGVVKRHGFHGGPQTHGQKNRLRAPGSIGNTSPQRVVKGRKMAGRMGGVRITTSGLLVAKIDNENHVVMIKGAVPGNNYGTVEIIKQ